MQLLPHLPPTPAPHKCMLTPAPGSCHTCLPHLPPTLACSPQRLPPATPASHTCPPHLHAHPSAWPANGLGQSAEGMSPADASAGSSCAHRRSRPALTRGLPST
eukprot:321533-Chlamydomonas_euryale.AAC.1